MSEVYRVTLYSGSSSVQSSNYWEHHFIRSKCRITLRFRDLDLTLWFETKSSSSVMWLRTILWDFKAIPVKCVIMLYCVTLLLQSRRFPASELGLLSVSNSTWPPCGFLQGSPVFPLAPKPCEWVFRMKSPLAVNLNATESRPIRGVFASSARCSWDNLRTVILTGIKWLLDINEWMNSPLKATLMNVNRRRLWCLWGSLKRSRGVTRIQIRAENRSADLLYNV